MEWKMPDLQTFAANVFIVDGPPVCMMGITFPTRMIVVKLADGSLWVNSPVSVPQDLLARIAGIGPIKYSGRTNPAARLAAGGMACAVSHRQLWAPPRIPKKFRRLPFTGTLGDAPPPGWAEDLEQLVFRGNCFVEEVYFLHKSSRTVIFGDFIQNHPPLKNKPVLNALFRFVGVTYPPGGVGLDIGLSFTDRKLARQSLEKLLAWDFDKLDPVSLTAFASRRMQSYL